MKFASFLGSIFLLLLLASCGLLQASSGTSSVEAETLHLVRSANLDQAQYLPLDRTITDGQAVHHLYITDMALPKEERPSQHPCQAFVKPGQAHWLIFPGESRVEE